VSADADRGTGTSVMARTRSISQEDAAALAQAKDHATAIRRCLDGNNGKSGIAATFSRVASACAHWAGRPVAFLSAAGLVIVWAATGPLFGFSDTWQLVINTSTTIITFLMVFLIQNTQNRDTLALQLKLSELIFVIRKAENRLATAEDLTEEELEALHEEFRKRAEDALGTLHSRRQRRKHAV
jgi:low affinity Fe/Cu permease